jgi:hypothetical protein
MATNKNDLKREIRATISTLFEDGGCTIEEKTAGQKYLAVSLENSTQRIAAIYGSLGGGASLWLKQAAWDEILPNTDQNRDRVEDVSDFRRGFQWAFHFDDPDDPMIQQAVTACINTGTDRWNKTQLRREADARRAKARAEREAKRAATKKDPWA